MGTAHSTILHLIAQGEITQFRVLHRPEGWKIVVFTKRIVNGYNYTLVAHSQPSYEAACFHIANAFRQLPTTKKPTQKKKKAHAE